jgi:hypothetical protein
MAKLVSTASINVLRLIIVCVSTISLACAFQRSEAPNGHVISGRVADPLNLHPEDAVLMLGSERDGSFRAIPIRLGPDGSFVTPKVDPDTYLLQVIRTPHSPTKAAVDVGLAIVPVGTADVSDVTVTIRPDSTVNGQFRMESDDPAAKWPRSIHVSAYLTFDGSPLLKGTSAEGAAGGRFILRNAFGRSVIRSGYELDGTPWSEWRVLLDGADITNVPTDFSTKDNSNLELVFTQHPSRLAGVVVDRKGQPVAGAWLVAFAADPTLWQQWATTSHAVQTDAAGAYQFATLPGQYLVRALPPSRFSSYKLALRELRNLARGASAVDLGNRETKMVNLTIDPE